MHFRQWIGSVRALNQNVTALLFTHQHFAFYLSMTFKPAANARAASPRPQRRHFSDPELQ